MVVFPNAKINIGLNVFPAREDGYHDLETVMVPVPWKDVLEIVPAGTSPANLCGAMAGERVGDDTLYVSGRHVDCPAEKNLVMKAVKAFRRVVDFPPVDIYLHKVIPDGAGLGGGSADAAFALRAVNELFELGCSNAHMAAVAAGIGADCPFFIYNIPMLCTGIGTTMEPVRLNIPEGLWIAIVKPPVGVSTKEAYAGVRTILKGETLPLLDALSESDFGKWGSRVANSFEESVFAVHPVVGEIRDSLTRAGALYASMSGSGSAVYAFFTSEVSEQQLSVMFPGCVCFAAKFS